MCPLQDCKVSAAVIFSVLMWQWSQSLEQAARNLITKYNVTVIVASGNSEEDSCYIAPGMPFPRPCIAKCKSPREIRPTPCKTVCFVYHIANPCLKGAVQRFCAGRTCMVDQDVTIERETCKA